MKAIALLLSLASLPLSARTWTDLKGRKIEAEIVRVQGDAVIVSRNGAELPIMLNLLSQADRDFVKQWQSQAGTPPAAASGPFVLGGKTVATGGATTLIEAPFSPEALKVIAKSKGRKSGTGDSSPDSKQVNDGSETGLKLAIAVPKDFQPAGPKNVFIAITAVNSEAERASGNISKFGMYSKICAENGWVCIGIDSNTGVPSTFATYAEAFALIEKSWPGFATSHFAAGGYSGGSKGCWGPIAWLAKNRRDVVGAFMGGCNEDYSERYRKEVSAPAAPYHKIRALLSTGRKDTIATTAHAESVVKSLKDNGVKKVRNELHDGGHAFVREHFIAALKWWEEQPEK